MPSSPSGTDANAGTWKMIVLSGPTQIDVPAPLPTSSEAYQAELAAIKAAQATLTDAQRQAIDYWAGGGVLRWNQVMRELVARYNLPPAPRDNGTYVCPGRQQPLRGPAVPLRQPTVLRARLQLRQRGPVRGAQGRLALQVPLQPPGAVAGGRRRPGPAAGERRPVLPVRGRRAVRGLDRDAPAPLPGRGRGDHPQGRRAARGGARRRPGVRERHRGGAGAGESRGRRARCPRRDGRDGGGRRHAGAVAGPRGCRRGARGDPLAEPGVAGPAADALRTSARCARG